MTERSASLRPLAIDAMGGDEAPARVVEGALLAVRELGLVNFRVPSDVRSLLFGSKIASLYVQPHIGGDIALLTGVAKSVLARGCEDRDFIVHATEGFDALTAKP